MSNELSQKDSKEVWIIAEKIQQLSNKLAINHIRWSEINWEVWQKLLFSHGFGNFFPSTKTVLYLVKLGYAKRQKEEKTIWNSTSRMDALVQWCDSNKEKIEHQRKRLNKNILQGHKRRQAYRRKNDIAFKTLQTLRNRMREALKGRVSNRKTQSLLGCSLDEFKLNFEKKFKLGMTWQNHGKWHFDHIRPCCSFDLTNPEEQKRCFHFSNLQPLWAVENLKKSGKYKRP